MFQFKTFSLHPVAKCCYKKSLLSFPVGPLQVLEGYYEVSSEPSPLQAEDPQLSQPVPTYTQTKGKKNWHAHFSGATCLLLPSIVQYYCFHHSYRCFCCSKLIELKVSRIHCKQ